MNIKRIIKEEMDWVDDIGPSLPNSNFLHKKVPVTISINDFLVSQYGYNVINIILEDGSVLELQMTGDYDIEYSGYGSISELLYKQGLRLVEPEPTEFNQVVMEEYLREYDMKEVPPQVDKVLRESLPLLDIKGIYVGDL